MIRLLRHPRPQMTEGLCYGRSDLALAPGWEAEIDALAATLPVPDRLLSSPLLRCAQPAARLAALWGVPVETDNRLIEMDFGGWEGRNWDEVPRAGLDEWAADFMQARPHGGENVAALASRVQDWLADHEGTDLLALTHLGVIRAAAAHADWPEPWQLQIAFGEIWCRERNPISVKR